MYSLEPRKWIILASVDEVIREFIREQLESDDECSLRYKLRTAFSFIVEHTEDYGMVVKATTRMDRVHFTPTSPICAKKLLYIIVIHCM